jgi:hypothetical protein
MKFLVKIEQTGYCYIEVEVQQWELDLDKKLDAAQMALKKGGQQIRFHPEKYSFILGEPYAKDVDAVDW